MTVDDEARRPLKVFLAASTQAPRKQIGGLLTTLGAEVILPTAEAESRQALARRILDQVAACDALIALGNPAHANPDVFVEVGYAMASNKRVLMVVPRDFHDPHPATASIPMLRAEDDDTEALRFAFSQFLAVAKKGPPRRVPGSRKFRQTSIGPKADTYLEELSREDTTEHQLVVVLQRALQDAGVVHSTEQRGSAGAVDIAAWVDEFDLGADSPLLIEVKRRPPTRTDLPALVRQLERYLGGTNSSYALLIHGGASEARPNELPENILFVAASDLVESMRFRRFGEVVYELRNKLVHGIE